MNRFLKDSVAICAVSVVLVVLATASRVRRQPTAYESAGGVRSVVADDRSAPQSLNGATSYMQQLGSSIATLGDARAALLQKAAQDPDDTAGLTAASANYRDSIVQLRQSIAALREDLGTEQTNAIVGMMISQTMTVSQRILSAEVFGDM
jgi:hypothetical protein